MELSNFLLLVFLSFLGLVLLGWVFLSRLQSLLREEKDDTSMLLMQQQIGDLRTQLSQILDNSAQSIQQQLGQMLNHVNERLKENAEVLNKTRQSLGERLDNAVLVVGNVQRSLGGLEEANQKIYEVGKDIASLQEILRAPKLRGGLGEFFLEELLTQILPPEHFSTQYRFRSGEKVDAVIKLGPSLVPVDAKFPLENFKRIVEAASDDEKRRAKNNSLWTSRNILMPSQRSIFCQMKAPTISRSCIFRRKMSTMKRSFAMNRPRKKVFAIMPWLSM